MKKLNIKNGLLVLGLLIMVSSCTKNFETLNQDKTKISSLDNASLDYVFLQLNTEEFLVPIPPPSAPALFRLSKLCLLICKHSILQRLH